MPEDHAALIAEAASTHGIDPNLIRAIVAIESRGNPSAVSRRGAKGLMQINPITQRHLGVKNPLDPRENINAGARYLADLQQRFPDQAHMLAAYNAGPGSVRRYNGVPPFPETQQYVTKVQDQLRALTPVPDTSTYAPTDVGFSNPLAYAGRMLGF